MFLYVLKVKKSKFSVNQLLFIITLFFSLFTSAGYYVEILNIKITYYKFFMLLFVVYNIICITNKSRGFKIAYKALNSIVFFLISNLIAFLLVSFNFRNNITIIPIGVGLTMSNYSVIAHSTPELGIKNIVTFLELILFLFFLIFSRDLLKNKKNVEKILINICKGYYIIFTFMIFEAVFNLIFPEGFFRICLYNIIGYDTSQSFSTIKNGIPRVYGLYSEPSHVAMSFLVLFNSYYYIQMNIKNDKKLKKYFSYLIFLSPLIALLTGSASVILVCIAGLFIQTILFRDNTIIKISIVLLVINSCFNKINLDIFELIQYQFLRFNLLISGEGSLNGDSEQSRNLALVTLLFGYLKCFIFGLGIGTTFGIGPLTTALISFGTLGTYLYGKIISLLCGYSIRGIKGITILLSTLGILLFTGTAASLYSPIIILIFIFLYNPNKNVMSKNY